MANSSEHKYEMTMSLNVLNHLGIGLYSNVPAVLSEAIANAWDADASHVDINMDVPNGIITIQDDGHGMSVTDANQKYLAVGYERRVSGGATSPKGRSVMGRKGIGKLSLFSIANTVEVHSVKDGVCHGFRMNIDDIRTRASDTSSGVYHPEPVDVASSDLDSGTRIILTDMKRRLNRTGRALRRRLARRFSVIGERHGFEIILDEAPVTIKDRGYHDKLQYIWTFGDKGDEIASIVENIEYRNQLPNTVELEDANYTIDGWIGTARKPGDLKEQETGESINGIIIMVRNKLAQENILDEFGDENLYSEYVIGEIHADFLDQDDKDDIATSSRQRLIEEDPRYQSLKRALERSLRIVQNEWRNRRNQVGLASATNIIPQIQTWYSSLNPDHKRAAERLFGKINQLKIESDYELGQLFISGILAFESFKLRNLLSRLDEVSPGNLGVLRDVFIQLDDLEATAYYQITKDRLEVISKFDNLVEDDEIEKMLQEHLYNHLWLLDPSWERATKTAYMERQIRTALDGVDVDLTEEERNSRLDIGYTTNGKKHVIIELKRSSRLLSTAELNVQIEKYYGAASKVLQQTGRSSEPIEFICVIGRPLRDWSNPDGERMSRNTLDGLNARVVMYKELIENASKAYYDYTERNIEAGRIHELIKSIESEYVQALRPEDAASVP